MKKENKVRLVFYMNQEDKIVLQDYCNKLDVKTSFFICNKMLEILGKPAPTIRQNFHNDNVTKSFLTQLFKIGSNLNQIARKLNSGAEFFIADQQVVLSAIETLKKQIIELNKKITDNDEG